MLSKFIGKGENFMKILVKNDLLTMHDQEKVQGYVYIKNYSVQPTKNGGSYIGGNLEAKGSLPFKVWSSAGCFAEMSSNNYNETICMVDAKVNVYGGSYSLVLEGCRAVDMRNFEYEVSDFYQEKYNAESYWNNLCATLKKHLSENAYKVFEIVVSGDVKDAFMKEFAAISHHDAYASGLLAHTTKVVKLATVVKMYPEIVRIVGNDLLFLGSALHDIGKTREYRNGVMSDEGKRISHLTSGILMLEVHRNEIEELMGIDFYIDLLSVISQHHGEYADRPRTVAATVINQIDCLDSHLTTLNEMLEGCEKGTQIIFGGDKLV